MTQLIIIKCIAKTYLTVSLISLTVTHTHTHEYKYTHPAACARLYAHYLFWFPWKPQPATARLQGGDDTVCDYVYVYAQTSKPERLKYI